jgi:hypothetical protein
VLLLWGCLYPSFYIQGTTRLQGKITVTIWSQSRLYLCLPIIYIFIDIIIYSLGSMSWSSEIFMIVGQVITDLSLGLLSLCGVVPRVPILVRKVGERIMICQNIKEKWNKNREIFFWLLKIGNLIQIVFYLKILQTICKWNLVLFTSSHRTKC